MSLPQIPQVDRDQAITNVIQSLALQEASIASLINAEAAKVDALVAAGIPAAGTLQEVESFQAAVAQVLQIAIQRQQAINEQLELLRMMMPQKREDSPTP